MDEPDRVEQLVGFGVLAEESAGAGTRVVAGRAANQTGPLVAFHRIKSVACATFDLPAIREFTRTGFADLRSRTD